MGSKTITTAILVGILLFESCLRKPENAVPTLADRINDNAGILTEQQKDSLFVLIKDLEVSLGPQIGIITIDSLDGEEIEGYSLRIAREMPIGRSHYKDGILICLSKKDKQIRIDAGKGWVLLLRMIP